MGLGVEVRCVCPSCGRNSLVLKAHPRGLFAFCDVCSLCEWLWSPEDGYEGLIWAARRFGIPLWKVQAAVESLASPSPSRRLDVSTSLASEIVRGRPDPRALGEAFLDVPIVFLNGRKPELEGSVEHVISHEVVHITMSRLFRGAPIEYVERIQDLWDRLPILQRRRGKLLRLRHPRARGKASELASATLDRKRWGEVRRSYMQG